MVFAMDVRCNHAQGHEACPFSCVDALDQAIETVVVHQEAHGPTVHAVDGLVVLEAPAQRIEHRAIAADGNDNIRFCFRHLAITADKLRKRVLCFGALGGEKGEA